MFSGTRPAGTAFTSTPSAPKITWNGLLTVEWLSGLMKKARAPWSQESAEEEARATANPASDATVTETARRIGLLSIRWAKGMCNVEKAKKGPGSIYREKGPGSVYPRFTRKSSLAPFSLRSRSKIGQGSAGMLRITVELGAKLGRLGSESSPGSVVAMPLAKTIRGNGLYQPITAPTTVKWRGSIDGNEGPAQAPMCHSSCFSACFGGIGNQHRYRCWPDSLKRAPSISWSADPEKVSGLVLR